MSDDRLDEFIQFAKQIEEFLEITSDKAIREAAYPETEWIENRGSKGNGFLGGWLNSYSSVAVQDKPPETRPIDGLLSLYKSEPVKQDLTKRAANIAQHWHKVKAHSCYKRFHGYANDRLRLAIETFEGKANLRTAPDALKSDLALLRFYYGFARSIDTYLQFDKLGHRQKYPDAKVLKKAKGHIESLKADFRDGLRLSNNHYKLEALLRQLSNEIDQAPRKDKETLTAAKRRALENFAYYSIFEFGEASATILGYFAVILGWDNYSTSTMDDIVATAKKKHQQATEKLEREKTKKLAEALRKPPAINAKK